ncbi:MAG: efflux RND transporter periplasmic adaptor subunit [Hydrogenophaga sp.]|uniref:efflux RND transporter periplasmic adaptor subunit n=1 Tax=Hydrogenophaga sp. TaxID=1904254 RepID=UPI002731AD6C|nr:efflux RND transporter periplasmic adaptor subunit [Hydrogenophaga sp.]MDP2164496.1 efflux RND transporter periplasmic adaptor subunit [Hydrogenophaga sp.]
MAKKIIYPLLAVIGIAVASGAAWWYQSKPKGTQEVNGVPAAAASAPVAGARAGSESASRPAGVEVARVEKISLRDDAQSVGSLRSRQSVMLRPEIPGRVKTLGFRDGAPVRKGQLLVQLDDTLQQAELKQALAQVSIAQASLKRNQELVAQNFVAQRVLEESLANLQVVEAQLALSQARLARMAIVAPFDGTVGIRNINLGDFVKDGADLVNLEDISSMYVDFRLPERYQGKLKPQQTVELALDAFPGRAFKARVDAIDPLLDANGRSVSVRALLPNTLGQPAQRDKPVGAATHAGAPVAKPGATGAVRGGTSGSAAPLRPGMFARVTTVFSVNNAALVVPEEAIVPQGGRQFVIKVVVPSALHVAPENLPPETKFVSLRQEVKLGVRRQGKVEITEGLSESQTVVVAGQQRLQKDGTPLRIVELGRPSPGAASLAGPTPTASAPAPAASR